MVLSIGEGAAVEAVTADLAVVHRPVQQCHAILRTGFCEDVADVVIHSPLADGEPVSNLLIGEAFGDQFDDFDLTPDGRSSGIVASADDMVRSPVSAMLSRKHLILHSGART